MAKLEILRVGPFDTWTGGQLDGLYDTHKMMAGDDVSTLPASAREVRVMALMGHATIDGAFMDQFQNLELIANFGVGFDAINIEDASARGIKVTNTPDVLSDEVADLALGMVIAQQRRFAEAEAYTRDGSWAAKGAFPLTRSLKGKRAGVVGLGRIGLEIAERLSAIKMEISYYARSKKDTPEGWEYVADVVELAAQSDVLVVALAGGPETKHLVNAKAIAALGAEGMMVNISRGSTIDEEAMITALESGALGSAALDVFENEPNIDPRFAKLKNALILPHVGSASKETRQAMGQRMLDNISAHVAGKPLISPVN